MRGSHNVNQTMKFAAPVSLSAGEERSKLHRLARLLGIQTSYADMHGRQHRASSQVLHALLGLWNVQAENPREVRETLRALEHERQSRALDSVGVVLLGTTGSATITVPDRIDRHAIQARILGEDGTQTALKQARSWTTGDRFRVNGSAFRTCRIRLPALPMGYHEFIVEFGGKTYRQILICAPSKSWSPPRTERYLGLFLPVYAAHSSRSWGAGSLKDWQDLAAWASKQGVNTMGTLPLLATFLEGPCADPSPYSPVSRLFWNEFYIDIPSLPEFRNCEAARQLFRSSSFEGLLKNFRGSDCIDYPAQMRARRRVLELLSRSFFRSDSPNRRRFEEFLRLRPGLEDYAQFRATHERSGRAWHSWERRLKHGELEPGDYLASDRDYHLYVQWAAHQQVTLLRNRAHSAGTQFYLDLPLGVHPDGYDAWRFRDLFAKGVHTGAPPDRFFTGGQDWGFAPLHPQAIRDDAYNYVREYLRFQMLHSDWLRIDHVMGLHRLFWIPQGFSAADGVYVSYHAEELYAILCLESHRHQTVLVGENLGTVPPEVNSAMDRHRLRKMYVVQFEAKEDPRHVLADPSINSVASLNTHDTPTFAAHFQAADVDLKAELKLISADAVADEKAARQRLNLALESFLQRRGFLSKNRRDVRAMIEACTRWLAASPAVLALVNIEDLWAELRPQNVPGTSSERPNWRRKSARTMEKIRSDEGLRTFLSSLRQLRRKPQP